MWDEDHLVFADVRSPGTAENLRSNPSIEINVVDQLARRGYRLKGTAAVYTDGELFERGVKFYEARGTVRARERIRGIVIVTVLRALPVTSPAYDIGFTEERNCGRSTSAGSPPAPQSRMWSTMGVPSSDTGHQLDRTPTGNGVISACRRICITQVTSFRTRRGHRFR